ncbi:MAG: hypothetical protein FWG69_04640 [Oscillospiraceae bacterium]|nr:hypothetical protein [Oscillospiraceae bacterium]
MNTMNTVNTVKIPVNEANEANAVSTLNTLNTLTVKEKRANRAAYANRVAGATLIELLVTLGIVLLISAVLGGVLWYALQMQSANQRLDEDQYNLSLSLLSISREAHRGVIKFPEEPQTGEGQLVIDVLDESTDLSDMEKITGTAVTYQLVNGTLQRTIEKVEYNMMSGTPVRDVTPGGSSPINFTPTELVSFHSEINDGKLTMSAEGAHGMKLSTTIALSRTPSMGIAIE